MKRLISLMCMIGSYLLMWAAYVPHTIQILINWLPSCHWLPFALWLRWIDIRVGMMMPMRKLGIKMIDVAVTLHEYVIKPIK